MNNQPLPAAEIARRLRAVEERIAQLIDSVGWAVISTILDSDDGPVPISYTVGLTERGLAELCIVGVSPDTSQAILHDLATQATAGDPLRHAQSLPDLLENFEAIVIEGPATGIVQPTVALRRYGNEAVRLQQIVWPDPHGAFPWQPGYTMPPIMQPTIGRP